MASEIIWSRSVDQYSPIGVVTDEGPVVFGEHDIIGLDSEDGERRWSLPASGITTSVTTADTLAYTTEFVLDEDDNESLADISISEKGQFRVRTLDLRTGESVFERSLHSSVLPNQPAPTVHGSMCYVHVFEHAQLIALSTDTGKRRWTVDMEDKSTMALADTVNQHPPVLINDVVVVTTTERNVRGYDCETGELRFVFEGGPTHDKISVATVKGDPPIVGVGAADGAYAYRVDTGERLWSFPDTGRPSTHVVGSGEQFLVSTEDGTLFALDPVSGEEIQSLEVGAGKFKSVAIDQDMVYGVTQTSRSSEPDQRLHAIAIPELSRRWSFDADDVSSLELGSDFLGVVMTPPDDRSKAAFGVNPEDGSIAWAYEVDSPVQWFRMDKSTGIVGTTDEVVAVRKPGFKELLFDIFGGD